MELCCSHNFLLTIWMGGSPTVTDHALPATGRWVACYLATNEVD